MKNFVRVYSCNLIDDFASAGQPAGLRQRAVRRAVTPSISSLPTE